MEGLSGRRNLCSAAPRRNRWRSRLVASGLALGLVIGGGAGLLQALPAAAAGTVTGVSFVPGSNVAHATSNWTIGFTVPSGLVTSSTITVDFPSSDFTLPSSPATVVLGSNFSGCTVASSPDTSSAVTITLGGGTCVVTPGTAVTLTIESITNQGAGTYASGLTVQTSLDSQSTSATVTIIGTSVSGVGFSATSYVAGQTGVTWAISFSPSAYGALGSTPTITVTFDPHFSFSTTTPTVTLAAGFGTCGVGSVSAPANVVTINLTGCGATTAPLVLDIADGINPAAASYPNTNFSVKTQADTTAASPSANVNIGVSPNGSGLMTVTPTAVGVATTHNTLLFTYVAESGVVSGGTLEIAMPTAAGWSAPSLTATAAGYTTSTCGTVTLLSASVVEVTGVTLGSGGSCAIAYGSTASGGPGSVAPLSAQVDTFSAFEASSPNTAVAALSSSPQVSVGTPLPTQIYGVDPIGTSIAISQAEFPTSDSASAVVLARDDFFSDALAGGPLAAYVHGPMLLTEGAPIASTLDPRTQAEIQRVLAPGGTVYILGGTLAINPNVDATLQGLGYTVVREAGTDEYDTAFLIAQQMGDPSIIFEATGTNYYDALSAVPAAIEDHAAILLTNGNVQSYATGLYIIGHPGIVRYAIGGPLAAAGADPGATAVYGSDLYATSAAVASTFFPAATMYGAATSATFTDALGGGVFMATGGRSGPLLIVNPSAPLPSEILPYLASLSSGTQGYVFGGPLAIGPDVLSALQAATG